MGLKENLIKRILREEFNELDWIKDVVTAKLSKNENWILINDVDRESISEGHEIQKYLFDLGYSWGTGDLKNHLKDFCIYTIYHFGNVKDDDHLYYGDGCRDAEVRISDKDIKSGEHMIYYWSDLKPKTIKEETDFDWVNEPRNNPLDGLRLTTPMGRLGDGLTIKDDGGTYVTVISSNGSSEYHRGTVKNFIKMGIWLPKKDINESNDFDWVTTTDDFKNEDPKVGDVIKVVYIGPRGYSASNYFLGILGIYKKRFISGVYGDYISGKVIELTKDRGYVIKEMNTGDEIYIPSPNKVNEWRGKVSTIRRKKLDFEFYHIIEPNSQIKESNDFDWAKDIQTNQDIAQDIVDKTDIWMGDNDLRVNLPFMTYGEGYSAKQLFKTFSLLRDKSPTFMFLEYLLYKYGVGRTITDYNINLNVSDIWFRYKNLITEKIVNFMDQH